MTALLRTLAPLAAACLLAAACSKNPQAAEPRREEGPAPAAPAATTASSAPALEQGQGGSGLSVPGMDFSSLPPAVQAELSQVLSDEFCTCGCPHALGACLKEHPQCRHAKRTTRLAARLLAAGASANETSAELGRYYATFRQKRAAFTLDPRQCKGNEKAPVTLVEFADFECPFCGQARPLLEAFAKAHPTEVRLCFAAFPLPMHPHALPAAQAALFARDQGKFWAMHDALFTHQDALDPQSLVAHAQAVGVDGKKLKAALDKGQYKDELEKQKAQGQAAGVNGTPTVFLNGRRYELGFDRDLLEHALEEELEWTQHDGWAKDQGR